MEHIYSLLLGRTRRAEGIVKPAIRTLYNSPIGSSDSIKNFVVVHRGLWYSEAQTKDVDAQE